MHPRGQEVLGHYSSKLTRFFVFLGLAVVAWEIAPVYASALRFHLALSEACRTAATGRHRPNRSEATSSSRPGSSACRFGPTRLRFGSSPGW